MASKPRVSVIMPSYNHVRFVGRAIESVLDQSFADFEFIITDDASSDGTDDVIRRYTDPRISFERFPSNQGACEAGNRCIERARGEYVALLNSDDFFLPGKLARQVAILDAESDLAAVFGLPKFVDESGEPIQPKRRPVQSLVRGLVGRKPEPPLYVAHEEFWFTSAPAGRHQWLRHLFFHGNSLCHPTVMIRRRIYEELGAYPVSLRQQPDLDMWVRVCARHEIRVLNELLVAFRILRAGGNTSAASAPTKRRIEWERTRILRRYAKMDEETLRRAFADDVPADIAARGAQMRVQLAFVAARTRVPSLRFFALETIQDAVEAGVPGVGPKDLHKLTGEIELFSAP